MAKNNKKLGNWGEDQACMFLMKRGFSILARNKSYKSGELDIVALKDSVLLVVEVKTSFIKNLTQDTESFRPELRVSHQKKQKIRKALAEYLREFKESGGEESEANNFKTISYAVIAIQICKETRSGRIRFIHDLVF